MAEGTSPLSRSLSARASALRAFPYRRELVRAGNEAVFLLQPVWHVSPATALLLHSRFREIVRRLS